MTADLSASELAAIVAAHELVAAGVPVFVARRDPSTRLGFALPPGWQRAPLDPQAVDNWRPGDALCAVMGHALDLIDIDPRNGGSEVLAGLQAAGMMPSVLAVAATPAGGRHYFVTALGVGSRDDVRPGLDVKGGRPDGSGRGFAFIAPTVRISKTTGEPVAYEWISPPWSTSMALEALGDDSGAAVAEMVRTALASHPAPVAAPGAVEPGDPFAGPVRTFTRAEASEYCMPELARFRAMGDDDHGFNQALNALAVRFGHFVPAFVSRADVEALLYEAADHNGSVSYQSDRAVRATIRSGLDAGGREPYAVDERGQLDGAPGPPGSEPVNADVPSADPVDILMGELLTAETIREMPNPRPLVLGVLDLDTTAWLIGKSGSYKSFVALDFAGCVGTGKPWHGHQVTQANVVYLIAEGARGTKLRVAAWEALYGPMRNVYFLPRPVQASNATAWSALAEVCRRLDAGLVIIDTQARVTVGMDENDNTAMGEYVERVDQIKRATGACVLTVHHIGRNGTDSRGASSIDGAQDSELRVRRDGDRRVTVVMDKQKDTDDTAEIELELARVEGSVDPDTARDLSSLAVVDAGTLPAPTPVRDWIDNLPANQAAVVGIFADHFTDAGGTKAEISRVLRERAAIDGRPAMHHSSFVKAWDGLLKKEIVVRIVGTQRFILPPHDLDEE